MISSFYSWFTSSPAVPPSITDETQLVNFTGLSMQEVMRRYTRYNTQQPPNKVAIQRAFYHYFAQEPNISEHIDSFLLAEEEVDADFYRSLYHEQR